MIRCRTIGGTRGRGSEIVAIRVYERFGIILGTTVLYMNPVL